MAIVSESLNGALKLFELPLIYNTDLELCLSTSINSILGILIQEEENARPSSIKYQICVHIRCIKREYNEDGSYTPSYSEPYLVSEAVRFDFETVHSDIDELNLIIMARFDNYVQNGSGWTLDSILSHRVKVYRTLYLAR